jgi:NTE family protein
MTVAFRWEIVDEWCVAQATGWEEAPKSGTEDAWGARGVPFCRQMQAGGREVEPVRWQIEPVWRQIEPVSWQIEPSRWTEESGDRQKEIAMDAMALSGGNIKGAYQAGVVATLLKAGYRPGIVTGISVGALNAGYLAGLTPRSKPIDWPAVGAELESFWRREVTGPDRFLKKRNVFDIAARLIGNKWGGLVNTDPLAGVVREALAKHDPRQTQLQVRVGAVDLISGGLVYRGPEDQDLVEYILASTAEPILMPYREIGGRPFYDGGLRDIAPLKQAIKLGATSLVCGICQPPVCGPVSPGFDKGNVTHLVTRVMDVITNEILSNDIEWFLEINEALEEGRRGGAVLEGKKVIPILVVRPTEPIPLNLTKFTSADIARMIEQGRRDTVERVREAQADPGDPGHGIAVRLTV